MYEYNVTEVKNRLGKCPRRQSWPNEKYHAGSVMDGLRQSRRNIRRTRPKYEPGTSQILVRSVNLWSSFVYCQFSIWSTFIGQKQEMFNCRQLAFHFCDLPYTPQWPHYAKWLEWSFLLKLSSFSISSHVYKTGVLFRPFYVKKVKKEVKVQQSRYRPGQGSKKLRFPDYMATAQDGRKVVSITHRPPLPPANVPDTHFC
jgi:hypothetical protein